MSLYSTYNLEKSTVFSGLQKAFYNRCLSYQMPSSESYAHHLLLGNPPKDRAASNFYSVKLGVNIIGDHFNQLLLWAQYGLLQALLLFAGWEIALKVICMGCMVLPSADFHCPCGNLLIILFCCYRLHLIARFFMNLLLFYYVFYHYNRI